MTTSFTTLPIVDLAPLSSDCASEEELRALSSKLHEVFATVGFAYLINVPLSFNHDDVFGIAREFFTLPEEVKMGVAKRTFQRSNKNTYRGYFPAQPGVDLQNLKAGFELGPSHRLPPSSKPSTSPFVLTEPNYFPPASLFPAREQLETLYAELSSLSNTLLALLASSLGKNPAAFTSILRNSISTLRLLHYPNGAGDQSSGQQPTQELSCTPHTDSGLLTLLHQDAIGGLEVQNAEGEWIPAPYVPGSLVVNVGDLMAKMSGGRFVATMHRVRSSGAERFSVPFFCEPGVDAMVGERGHEVRYEEFVLDKMGTWVEFQDPMEEEEIMSTHSNVSITSRVEAY
ncbi:putative 2-oxoglutarate-dependent dioxygenase DIN11 [Cladobotryum mycophilum]|uniref:2-oxoglutarate-dependent dioxygenase DIN11 n=1 Tax=Cladobotryum mycophilum TaxID=491253 RepID=A0ABR0SX94_9HYPO